ncbi:DNA-binding transcriptional LysR family regulator [Thermocatellispora tengchongensis]|uniref:DNA-binding transcriptional LysR family regulator n=1 Tax=Thermocatellispora tengchongensis TaxID=1073253 RepID=A0A840NTV3_9ACTN|nr:LysR family transcriptional regulator [Thermocatellispora tengchongensis]MBB5132164.1 DNA-binding transcriptional LysR family regulator [Thermocatellispora tengchongensis]
MTLDDLRVFIAVYETGNLSTVARTMSCTQSAVSQHVRRLERETGLALIERRPRGVVPTQAGRILYQAAQGGIASLDAALRRLGELRDGNGGAVKISTGGVTVRHFMADAITAFRSRHPHVTLEFRSAQSARRCIELLHSGRVDLAWITLGQPLPGVQQRPVIDLPWVLVTHRDDPLAAREAIEPDDLPSIRYIAHPENSASRRRLEEDFVRVGFTPPPPVGVADWDTAVLLAELGIGHAVVPALPRLVLSPGSPAKVVPIPALNPITVGWAVRQWDALSPLATEFADLVAGG